MATAETLPSAVQVNTTRKPKAGLSARDVSRCRFESLLLLRGFKGTPTETVFVDLFFVVLFFVLGGWTAHALQCCHAKGVSDS